MSTWLLRFCMKLLVHHSSCEMSPLSNDKYGNMLDSTIFLIHFTGESYLFLYNDIPYLKVFKLKKKKVPRNHFSSLPKYFHHKSIFWLLLVRKKVKSLSRVQLFAAPQGVAYQAPPSTRFSRQKYWSRLPFPSPGDLPNPGIKPGSPASQADALLSEPPGKPHY